MQGESKGLTKIAVRQNAAHSPLGALPSGAMLRGLLFERAGLQESIVYFFARTQTLSLAAEEMLGRGRKVQTVFHADGLKVLTCKLCE